MFAINLFQTLQGMLTLFTTMSRPWKKIPSVQPGLLKMGHLFSTVIILTTDQNEDTLLKIVSPMSLVLHVDSKDTTLQSHRNSFREITT